MGSWFSFSSPEPSMSESEMLDALNRLEEERQKLENERKMLENQRTQMIPRRMRMQMNEREMRLSQERRRMMMALLSRVNKRRADNGLPPISLEDLMRSGGGVQRQPQRPLVNLSPLYVRQSLRRR
jgi:hypothetical protein